MLTSEGTIPIKTAEGLDELARRTRRLSQRHRTVLLLVDGKRSREQVFALAFAAGVQQAVFDELMALGLIAFQGATAEPEINLEPPTEMSALADIVDSTSRVVAVDRATGDAEAARAMPGDGDHAPPIAAESDPVPTDDSQLPSVQSLLPDSAWSELGARALRRPSGVDRPLEEARDILLRAVRAEAPIAGRLLLVKIKRASSRVEIDALLDEVEARISKPRRMIMAAQTLRHVRHLLGMPADTAAMYGSRP